MTAGLTDPVVLACTAQDASRWILAAFGFATAVQVALFLAFTPWRRTR